MPNKWDPAYWFITFREADTLLARRKSWVHSNDDGPASWNIDNSFGLFKDYTDGNEVTALVDGQAYMQDLWKELTKLKPALTDSSKDAFVLIAGWEFWAGRDAREIWHKPTPPSLYDVPLGSKLQEYLEKIKLEKTGLEKRGEVRLIAYDNAVASKYPKVGTNWNEQLVEFLNEQEKHNSKAPRTIAVLDRAKFAMSHHQKAVVVGADTFKDSCAYVGGIDLAKDRLDNPSHSKSTADKRFVAWHDIQVKVSGPAVVQIWANFSERWESLNAWRPGMKPCPVPTWASQAQPKSQRPAKQSVQVLRTVGPASAKKRVYRFLPDGETTVLAGLKKAISKAERYIYIEDQFLWDCELADRIRDRMQQKPDLHLIVVIAAETEFPGRAGDYHYHLRSGFFMKVMGVNAKDQIAFGLGTRVHAFGLYQYQSPKDREDALGLRQKCKAIYVHSKLVLIDDRYVAIGSANVNQRSLSIETELTLGIVDRNTVKVQWGKTKETVCIFAKDLREQLWKEHSNFGQALNADPIEALKQCFPPYCNSKSQEWPDNQASAKAGAQHHLRCYINKPGKNILTQSTGRIFDRSERWWLKEKQA